MSSGRKRQKREPTEVPTLSTIKTSAQQFWSQYVSQRQPCKFDSHVADSSWRAHLWTNQYLRAKAGSETVRVEVIQHNDDNKNRRSFGLGQETSMTFSAFLDHLEAPAEKRYYLTTQELVSDLEDRPSVTSPPVEQLVGDFPWVPELCGHLILQNANIWFGSAQTPTSSGLHHDFHDNLYLLLRGVKHITLFPPEAQSAMYLNGTISRMHPNGRINYEGHEPTNADGSHVHSQALRDQAARLDQLGARLDKIDKQKGSGRGHKGTADDDEEGDVDGGGEGEDEGDVEAAIDREMEALLEAEMDGDGCGDDDDDDDDDDDGGAFGGGGGEGDGEDEDDDDDDNDDDDDEGQLVPASISNAIKQAVAAIPSSSRPSGRKTAAKSAASSSSSSSSSSPPNFSRVDTSLPLPDLQQQFPLYTALLDSHAHGPRHVTLRAGEMLFIPAGWFHEVRSEGGGAEGHLAFNYWLHPPDCLREDGFAAPYSSDFWRRDWEARRL